jgi:hypothetical protein
MEHTAARGAEVIEYVRFGIGMRLAVSAEDGALVFRDKGYIWRVAGLRIAAAARPLHGHGLRRGAARPVEPRRTSR